MWRKILVVGVVMLSRLGSLSHIYAQPDTMWTRTFGGSKIDVGYSVHQTTDGGYIIAGTTHSYSAGYGDVWLIKTDANGNELWNKPFGGAVEDEGYSCSQTTDGGYIITGMNKSYSTGSADLWLIKTDANGNKLWDKRFGASGDDYGYSVQETSDGGYIITGYTKSYGPGYVWLIKTDANGNKLWDKTFGGHWGYSVLQTTDGGYIITGVISVWGVGTEILLIKTDSVGNKLWDKTFGGNGYDYGYSGSQTTDGGYIITGSEGNMGLWLIKTDSVGNKLWDKTFGGVGDAGHSVSTTTDGGYIITGVTPSWNDGLLIKTNSVGNKLWDKTFGGTWGDYGNSVLQTTDGGYIITGVTNSYGAGGWDVWLIKVGAEGVEENSNLKTQTSKLKICPNPFTTRTVIEFRSSGVLGFNSQLKIYDLAGSVVRTFNHLTIQPFNQIVWDGRADNGYVMGSGIYFCNLKVGNWTSTQKLICIR